MINFAAKGIGTFPLSLWLSEEHIADFSPPHVQHATFIHCSSSLQKCTTSGDIYPIVSPSNIQFLGKRRLGQRVKRRYKNNLSLVLGAQSNNL